MRTMLLLCSVLLWTNRLQADSGAYNLADFGPVKTPAEAEATLQAAITNVIAKGGGLLVVTTGVAPEWKAHNPAPSSTQAGTPTVTVIDRRGGVERTILPSNGQNNGMLWTGRQISRAVRQPIDMTFGVHSTETIDTCIAGGTTSYDQAILDEVKAGKDARIHLPSMRGLAVGNHMALSGTPRGYGNPYDRGPIKALGWDKKRGAPYAVMDLEHDHPKDALFYDKHVVNSMTVTDYSQSDNQSMSLIVARKNYGQGDSFVISAGARTMGNVMSGAGDEGGLTYASDISNDLQPFRSKVESVDWSKGELVYEPGPVRNHTLGTSRPLINFNSNKWVAAGTVWIVAPGHRDPWDPANQSKTGHTHEGAALPGGAIIGSKDCGWTKDVVGRFFAVDEPSEYLDPKNDPEAGYTAAPDIRVHRWYQIMKFEERPDGTKRIYIERTRWWTRHDVAPTLYDFENYTWDQHLKPLRYIIAPGAQVADVSRAWTNSENSAGHVYKHDPRTLILAPSSDAGAAFDFAKGDPIAQAIGSDPWNVTGMRVRHFNYLPSTIEDASYACVNWGRVTVDAAFGIHGAPGLEDRIAGSKDHRPAYLKGVDIASTTRVGVRFGADVQDAAIVFEQPHDRAQPMVWHVNDRPTSKLTVDPKTGDFQLQGGATRVTALRVEPTGGISGGDKPARNLRGIAVPVKAGANELKVQFARPEADAHYAVQVQPSWFTAAVVEKTATDFTARFEKPAPDKASLDWILVR
ncbi:MAG: hypothetical protein HY360_26570 [Verrucomicrobia bacterium]|nr:hypothetical protein [Verrucomicrobiota bacterium]